MIFKYAILLLAPLLASAAPSAALSADDILKKADAVRNPAESYRMKVTVESRQGDDTRESAFEVMIQGREQTLIRTLKPSRDRGRNLLMRGKEMWAYIPNIKRAVRVSLSQKLTGEAANGDLSRLRWSGDYDVKIESRDEESWTLYLTAKERGLTYDKIRVRVLKESFRPVEAEYLSVSGKALKKVKYAGYRKLAGAVRPSEIRIRDAIREGDRSVIRIGSMKVQKFPESLFRKSNLGRTE